MLRRRYIAILLVGLAATVGAHSAWPPPAPFGKYLVYTAANVYDPSVPPAEGDLADWFHRQVMGRDDAAIATERAAADAYFTATFGNAYIPGSLEAFALDPRVGYTAYFVSGQNVPPEGSVVRDGGFRADLTDGTFVVYGDYNIKATRSGRSGREPQPIIIHTSRSIRFTTIRTAPATSAAASEATASMTSAADWPRACSRTRRCQTAGSCPISATSSRSQVWASSHHPSEKKVDAYEAGRGRTPRSFSGLVSTRRAARAARTATAVTRKPTMSSAIASTQRTRREC